MSDVSLSCCSSLFGIYSMKPVQTRAPWSTGVTVASALGRHVCGWSEGVGNVPHEPYMHVFSAAGLSMRSCLEHPGVQVTDTIHGIV